MKYAFRLALLLLGIAVGWSAIQHWFPSTELVEHYRAAGLGETGRITVAVLQSAAAIGLLLPSLQVVAGAILAVAMVVIGARNAYLGDISKIIEPLLIASWSAISAWGLRRAAIKKATNR